MEASPWALLHGMVSTACCESSLHQLPTTRLLGHSLPACGQFESRKPPARTSVCRPLPGLPDTSSPPARLSQSVCCVEASPVLSCPAELTHLWVLYCQPKPGLNIVLNTDINARIKYCFIFLKRMHVPYTFKMKCFTLYI